MKHKKVNRINIYLTNQDKKVLNELKYKYHLSYSTLAKVIIRHLAMPCKLDLINFYIYNDQTKCKTSIKPKEAEYHAKRTMVYTNGIKIFTRDDLKNYVKDERKIQSIKAKIQRDMEQEIDDNWNGNSFTRQLVRTMKKNKEYYKKVLEQC